MGSICSEPFEEDEEIQMSTLERSGGECKSERWCRDFQAVERIETENVKWRCATQEVPLLGRHTGHPAYPAKGNPSYVYVPQWRVPVQATFGGPLAMAQATVGELKVPPPPATHSENVTGKASRCDKCDGKHPTERCPHFKKDREHHKDAWVNYGCKKDPHQMGGSGGNFVLRNARVIPQPGDGSCLYHALCYGLRSTHALALRRELAQFLRDNPKLEIAGDTLEDWVRWDSNSSVREYTRRQAVQGWGGGIEMACCSALKHVNIHVYESMDRYSQECKRISCFNAPHAEKTIHVLYQGGLHYDALQPLAG
eukprot:s344_g3.t1